MPRQRPSQLEVVAHVDEVLGQFKLLLISAADRVEVIVCLMEAGLAVAEIQRMRRATRV